jgi:Flp pilus assembly protein TadG
MSKDRGSVTAETALALPVLVVVLALAVWVLAAVGAQLRCVDAAGAAARAAARGESSSAVTALARRLAPADAQVRVADDGEQVAVTVSAQVRPFGPARVLPGVDVDATSVALREPGLP